MMSGLVLSCLLALAAAAPNALGKDSEPPRNHDTTGLTPFGNDSRSYGNRANQDVVNGVDSIYGYYNYILVLRANGQFICGASLISPTRGLTAAHCILSGYRYSVIAGDLDRSRVHGHEIGRSVNSIVKHPNYVDFYRYDIAVLKFDSIPNNEYVKPIPRLTHGEVDAKQLRCYIAGWGKTSGSSNYTSHLLKYGHMKVITTSDCIAKMGNVIYASHVCVEKMSKMRSACQGDSGGPLECYVPGIGFKLLGVSSFVKAGCTGEYPSVYTRITSFENFINSNM